MGNLNLEIIDQAIAEKKNSKINLNLNEKQKKKKIMIKKQ